MADYATAGQKTRVLNGVSLTIRQGEMIGIAGRSGSGKSTWLKVLLGLLRPTSGRLELCGVPIEEIAPETIGRLIGYVGQTPFIFAGTIADNITYGCEGASQADIRRAAQLAAIDDEIMAMPLGYESSVTERGQNLSGGQRQRIALARVFLKNPKFMILDESTSALDTISERKIQKALAALRADHTIILVAHRLSTLQAADRILVFDDGRIAESGTFDELLASDGLFATLAQNGASKAYAPNADRSRAARSPRFRLAPSR
jgi:ATP-binding cassette subfamily B protein